MNNIEWDQSIRPALYSTRTRWIMNAIGDIEHCAVSCLLRAPRGGEARAILDRMPRPLTLRPLEELVDRIRRRLLFYRWDEVLPELEGEYFDMLRCYTLGHKRRFTEPEATAHRALVDLFTAEGGRSPWA